MNVARRAAALAAALILAGCGSGAAPAGTASPASSGAAALQSAVPQSPAATPPASPSATLGPTPAPTQSPAPTPPPFSLVITMVDASGAPATDAHVYGNTANATLEGTAVADGVRLLAFGKAGTYCIAVQPGRASPQYTIGPTGSLVANSMNDPSMNPKCAYKIGAGPAALKFTFPAMTVVSGTATGANGKPCGGSLGGTPNSMVTADKGALEAIAVSDTSGKFTIHLTAGKWTLTASNLSSQARTISVTSSPMSGVTLHC